MIDSYEFILRHKEIKKAKTPTKAKLKKAPNKKLLVHSIVNVFNRLVPIIPADKVKAINRINNK
ncbi:MAG: hypothetical protein QM528_02915 [Phycisphaerales bacterium]|nr:hypothetical protein [Phycisphaerales bacterium]